MAKTYADTPRTIGSFDGTELIVVQDGTTPAPEGFAQMKKTTLSALRTFMQDGVTRSLIYRGSCTYAELLAKTGMNIGDMWNVTDKDGQNYAWTGSEWDALGESKDLSWKADKSYVDTELAKKADVTYVDEKVAEAKPSDYESVKASVVAISAECEALKKVNAEQNDRITNLEYENRITKAVLSKKIAEETEATGSVIPFPSTGEDGYPLAEWGLQKRLKSKSVVWNQLMRSSVFDSVGNWYEDSGVLYSVANSVATIVCPDANTGIVEEDVYKYKVGHVYLALVRAKVDAPIRIKFGGFSFTGTQCVVSATTSFADYYDIRSCINSGDKFIINTDSSGGTIYVERAVLIDLTQMFGAGSEPTSLTDIRIALIKKYAESHPQYDAGTLLDSVYESGVSVGANIFDKDSVTDNMYIIASGEIRSLVKDNVWVSDYIPTKGNPSVSVKNCGGVAFYDSDYALVGSVGGKSVSVFRTYDVPTGAMFFRIDSSTGGQDKNAVMCVYGNYTESRMPPYAPYREPSTLDLSFLNSVEDIGIEGTVIDFEKEEVTWNYGKVDLGDFSWTFSESYSGWYMSSQPIQDAKFFGGSVVPNWLCKKFVTASGAIAISTSGAYIGQSSNGNIMINSFGFATQTDFENAINGVELVYELDTPITKTFSYLGIVIPSSWDGGKPWIRVEAGGSFHIVSGTPAKATVSFLTNLGGN